MELTFLGGASLDVLQLVCVVVPDKTGLGALVRLPKLDWAILNGGTNRFGSETGTDVSL